MSSPAASTTNEPRHENIHRVSSSSLFSLVKGLITGLLQSQLMRRAINLINRNPRPYDIAADQSSLLFSSLPYDVVLNCLARVSRRYYPNLSCVSKSFQSLVRSPELAHMRSLIGKDDPVVYVCFSDTKPFLGRRLDWFTLNPNEKKTSVLNSFQVFSYYMLYCPSVSIGSKIYFVGGCMYKCLPGLLIFDSWSGELCVGPSMKEARMLPGVAVVNGKLYVMGGCREDQIQVEVFDPNSQTWEVGPLSSDGEVRYGKGLMRYGAIVTEAVALEGKVYCMSYKDGSHIIYDTKDGKCETFLMADGKAWRRGGVCVVNSVIYVYYINLGVMWYDPKDKVWREVKGLNKLDYKSIDMVGMVDCNGKLGFLWGNNTREIISGRTEKRIWCEMIVLERSGVEIHGTVEWSDLVGFVPHDYEIWRCLGVSY
ncbi:F-box domain [Arabidopsis thaliana x Arabidopsis arenosa]|nr:F-box domain [Arabidopsis thaliana x Arabidopsis arenosa]KAG7641633.1 F-box domain [Arabidopsis suecica]OAP09516.1 hypothetical protein AXX17_AT2G17580 [Arabidopsis thaliana]